MGTSFAAIIETEFDEALAAELSETFDNYNLFRGLFICWFKDSSPTVGADIFIGELREISRKFPKREIKFTMVCDEADDPIVGSLLDGAMSRGLCNTEPFDEWFRSEE